MTIQVTRVCTLTVACLLINDTRVVCHFRDTFQLRQNEPLCNITHMKMSSACIFIFMQIQLLLMSLVLTKTRFEPFIIVLVYKSFRVNRANLKLVHLA